MPEAHGVNYFYEVLDLSYSHCERITRKSAQRGEANSVLLLMQKKNFYEDNFLVNKIKFITDRNLLQAPREEAPRKCSKWCLQHSSGEQNSSEQ